MTIYRTGLLWLALCAVTSCGSPRVSGLYFLETPRQVYFVQLIEAKDGKVSGRSDMATIESDGAVSNRSIPVDGVVSQRELLFKPASMWTGGLDGTGTFSDHDLTVVASGTTLKFQKSSLPAYQAAIARLQDAASNVRQQLASMQAVKTARDAQAREVQTVIDTGAKIDRLTAELRNDTVRMNAGVANSPDFGKRALANSERIERMMRVAPGLSDMARNQLTVQANQVEVGTNQIEVARSQYGMQLAQLSDDAGPIADRLEHFCDSVNAAQFTRQCEPARAAVSLFRSSMILGHQTFSPYKQVLQLELRRQSVMIQRLEG